MPYFKKTFVQKPADVTREWILIDAKEAPVGRVATVAAGYLMGSKKVTYTAHVDAGDYVVVINAKDFVATGDKELAKRFYHHTGFPGGIKYLTMAQMRAKHPEQVIERAVKGMLPKNKLQADRLKRLKIFPGAEHTHAPQTPRKVDINPPKAAKVEDK